MRDGIYKNVLFAEQPDLWESLGDCNKMEENPGDSGVTQGNDEDHAIDRRASLLKRISHRRITPDSEILRSQALALQPDRRFTDDRHYNAVTD